MLLSLLLSLQTSLFAGPALLRPEGQWEPSVSYAVGYSHYRAQNLNEVLTLLERLTRESAGLNPYTVKGFDGHPASQASIGLRKGPWNAALEVEFWTETFAQTEVPFNLEDNSRAARITCDDLRAQNNTLSGLAGCIQAAEEFNFLPVTLQLAWMPQWTSWLRAGAGYGVGVLGGSAHITLTSDYFGPGAAPDDQIRFGIIPDPLINPVQKFFVSAQLTPGRWLGVEWRGGLRRTRLGGFTLDNAKGSSQVFDAAFDYPKNGDQLWIRWPTLYPDRREIWIGSRAEAKAQSSRFGHQLVEGDFDGWFTAVSLQLRWGAKK